MELYIIKLSAMDTAIYHSASWRRSGLQNIAEAQANDRGCDVYLVDAEGQTLFEVSPRMGGRS